MYNSRALLPARGQMKVKVLFRYDGGLPTVEVGYSQSVNVARHYKQMVEEAVLNAFYKANHRLGGVIFNKDNYNEQIHDYIESLKILTIRFSYFEDRIYSYKRANVNGRYRYVIRRKGKVYRYVQPKYISKKKIKILEQTTL